MGIKIVEFHRRSNKGNLGNPNHCTPKGKNSSYFGLFSTLKGCVVVLLPYEANWTIFGMRERCSILILHTS